MPTPEEQARRKIDQLLDVAGWQVQDRNALKLGAARGVAGELGVDAEVLGVKGVAAEGKPSRRGRKKLKTPGSAVQMAMDLGEV